MMVSSPLHRQNVKPNLRKVNSTDSIPSPSQKTSKKLAKELESSYRLSNLPKLLPSLW
jgi:hypothetical protein